MILFDRNAIQMLTQSTDHTPLATHRVSNDEFLFDLWLVHRSKIDDLRFASLLCAEDRAGNPNPKVGVFGPVPACDATLPLGGVRPAVHLRV